MSQKEIPLSQGKFAIVDEDDFQYLTSWKWYYGGGEELHGEFARQA